MASVIDDVVAQALNTGAAEAAIAAANSRTRGYDQTTMAISAMLANYTTTPSVMMGQGVRMLNGTPTMAPGNAPNANSAG